MSTCRPIVRETIKEIGYNDSSMGFDWETCAVLTSIDEQSPDIKQGVDESDGHEQGAGDQGLMFGYACDETPELMPMPIILPMRLTRRLAEVRKKKILDFLRPDGKSQVTIQYINGSPVRVDSVVIAAQHSTSVSNETLKEGIIEEVIMHVIPEELRDKNTKYYVNTYGPFCGRRAQGRLRPDRTKDHRRYLRRVSEATAAAVFPGRTLRRWTGPLPIWPGMSPRMWWRPDLQRNARFSLPTASAWPKPVSVMIDTSGTSEDPARSDCQDHLGSFRSEAEGHHPVPGSPQAHLQEDGLLRPFRQK